jgi:hypothetical protein
MVLLLPFASAVEMPRLSEREILARCYNQLTGDHLTSKDILWGRLKLESASSICSKLLDTVQFDNQGQLTEANNKIARSTFKQFIDIHRTWFDQQWAHLNTFPEFLWGAVDIYDPQEPALFLTRNLFLDEPYANVLKGSFTAKALRDGSKLISKLQPEAQGFLRPSRLVRSGLVKEGATINSTSITYVSTPPFTQNEFQLLATPIIQMGDPIGIKLVNYSAAPLLPVLWTNVLSPSVGMLTDGITLPQPLLANRGGGALGSIPYLMLNWGHGLDYIANGAEKLPRRYILSVFKNFLCRSGPFVRTSDVAPWKSNITQAPAFRKSEACLRCHTSLDQAAIVLRNMRLAATTPTDGTDFRSAPVIANYDIDPNLTPKEFWPSTSDPNFHKTRPEGRLIFRSITGELVNVSIDNLESLGHSIAQTPDYYACAAKRYFEFFTKNKIILFDPYDPSNEPIIDGMSPTEHEMRSFVLALGQELQKSGSLKQLVRRILDSEYYGQGNFGK